MELIEGSETSAIRTQTPGNYPKENILHYLNGFCKNICTKQEMLEFVFVTDVQGVGIAQLV